jgi:hypothetical protein
MSRHAALHLAALLLILASSSDARAGVTISDRRYWPSEARGSPEQVIEVYPAYSYAGTTPAFVSRAQGAPRGKARRTR